MLKSKRFIVAVNIAYFLIQICNGQEFDAGYFAQKENDLAAYYNIALNSGSTEAEEQFAQKLFELINTPNSWQYPFDSLKYIGKTVSPNNMVLVYSWNFPKDFGYSDYYAIVQYVAKKGKAFKTHRLRQIKETVEDPFLYICDTNKWIGALYYEIVETKFHGTDCYTLIGYNFGNVLSNKKILEAICFNKEMDIRFEPNMFFYENKICNRIEFEYSEHAQMMVKYNAGLDKIVFDHLAPERPSLQGQYQFYGPDASNDAFTFIDGIWRHESNIKLQN